MPSITLKRFNGNDTNTEYDKGPNECPFCHSKMAPRVFQGFLIDQNNIRIIFQCPNENCKEVFIAYYQYVEKELPNKKIDFIYELKRVSIGNIKTREFSKNILGNSPAFVEIYNQALKAEETGLTHIAGIGYRKAIEFLIKDYLIKLKPENEEDIKKKFLGKCITDDVSSPNIKMMAERAVWIGNDEAHYIRKWIERDVNDLKKIIDVTVHWIDMELTTQEYLNDMPEGKK